ncbi:hypothetical protein K9N50_01890 [bacterium]|nr:hypothetical protein [bacterium]
MKQRAIPAVLIILALIITANSGYSAGRTSVGLVGGMSIPMGWWGERWDPLQSGEINLRYEFTPGFGILLLAGLNKTYFSDLSADEIYQDSRYHDVQPEYEPYRTVITAEQGGSFKQLPVGFGFYHERMLWRFRAYGSVAMVIYNWKFTRSQDFEQVIAPPGMSETQHVDNWSISNDGTNMGAQAAIGFVYKISSMFMLDVSAAYHMINIYQKNGAAAYWGEPALVPPGDPQNDLVKDAEGAVDFLQIRLGLRIGT